MVLNAFFIPAITIFGTQVPKVVITEDGPYSGLNSGVKLHLQHLAQLIHGMWVGS
jgi:hypothetical protein